MAKKGNFGTILAGLCVNRADENNRKGLALDVNFRHSFFERKFLLQSRSPSLRSSGRNARLWDNPLPDARNSG
jgi:hypothetical protein